MLRYVSKHLSMTLRVRYLGQYGQNELDFHIGWTVSFFSFLFLSLVNGVGIEQDPRLLSIHLSEGDFVADTRLFKTTVHF